MARQPPFLMSGAAEACGVLVVGTRKHFRPVGVGVVQGGRPGDLARDAPARTDVSQGAAEVAAVVVAGFPPSSVKSAQKGL